MCVDALPEYRWKRLLTLFRRAFVQMRYELFPSEQEMVGKKWRSDGGDEKFRYDYDLNSDSLVIDLGGYKGQWTSDIYARYNCRILVFEPVKLFAEKIAERFSSNSRIEVYNFALGSTRRQELISVDGDRSSSLRNTSSKELIQFEDVVEFIDKHDIGTIDLLKINIEGGEYELLPRMFEAGLINRVKTLQIQFHNVGPDSAERMGKIHLDLLLSHRPTYQYRFVWENWVRFDA